MKEKTPDKPEKEYPKTIEALLKQQPLTTQTTGELKIRRVRAEVSVDNMSAD